MFDSKTTVALMTKEKSTTATKSKSKLSSKTGKTKSAEKKKGISKDDFSFVSSSYKLASLLNLNDKRKSNGEVHNDLVGELIYSFVGRQKRINRNIRKEALTVEKRAKRVGLQISKLFDKKANFCHQCSKAHCKCVMEVDLGAVGKKKKKK